MSSDNRDLEAVAALAILCAAAVITVPLIAVRAIFAVPLALALPGYALTAAAFARHRISGPQWLMLVPALSLMTLVLGALLLDLLPGGLRIGSWTGLLVIVVLGAAGLAVKRRVHGDAPPRRHFPHIRARDAILLGAGIVSACGALILSRVPLGARNAVGYTTLWMLPNGTPRAPAVRIGVISAQQHQAAYRLILRSSTGAPAVVATHLVLRPGSQTEFEVPLRPSSSALPTVMTAELYLAGSTTAYRHVTAVIVQRRASP